MREVEMKKRENQERRDSMIEAMKRHEKEFEEEVKRIREGLEKKEEIERKWFEDVKMKSEMMNKMKSRIEEASSKSKSRVTTVEVEQSTPEFKFVVDSSQGEDVQIVWRIFSERSDVESATTTKSETAPREKLGGKSKRKPGTRVAVVMEKEEMMKTIESGFDEKEFKTPMIMFTDLKDSIEAAPPAARNGMAFVMWCRVQVEKMETEEEEKKARMMIEEGGKVKSITIPTNKIEWKIIPEIVALIDFSPKMTRSQESEIKHIEIVFNSLVSFCCFFFSEINKQQLQQTTTTTKNNRGEEEHSKG